MTWVPVSSTGMTEFFLQKILFVLPVIKFLFIAVFSYHISLVSYLIKKSRRVAGFFIIFFDAMQKNLVTFVQIRPHIRAPGARMVAKGDGRFHKHVRLM